MQYLSCRLKALPLIALSLLFLVPAMAFQTADASTVSNGDFQAQSFSKVVDWYDYVRQYAANNNLPQPNATEHAYIYANYVNVVRDRKSTRLNSSHVSISYAVFCLKKKK